MAEKEKIQKVANLEILFLICSNIVKDYNEIEKTKSIEEHRLPLFLPKISPHILSSRVAESNIIPPKHLQTILGYSNIQMPMNVYAEISDEVLKEFMAEFEKSGNIDIEV